MITYENNKSELIMFKITDVFSCYSHIHKQLELCFCKSGSMEVTCERKNYTLTENSYMIILPETEHSYISSADLYGVILIINPMLIPHLSSYMNKKLKNPVIYDKNKEIGKYIADLMKNNENTTIAKGFLYVILGLLFSQCEFEEIKPNHYEDLCYNVIKYMSDNFKSSISLDSIAQHFGINPSYLSRVFNKKIGCGICDVLHGYRVDYAKHLLTNTNMPITDISFESGFTTQRNFNRWFYRLENCTPNNYRKYNSDQ